MGGFGEVVQLRWVGAGLDQPRRGSSGCLWSSPASCDVGPSAEDALAPQRGGASVHGRLVFCGEDSFNRARAFLQLSPESLQLPGVSALIPANPPEPPCSGGCRGLWCFPGPKQDAAQPSAGACFGRGSSLDG